MRLGRREEEETGIAGGRFVNPNVLPPVRTTRIQGGKFVNPNVLPPVRSYKIQDVDWENAYHFGRRA